MADEPRRIQPVSFLGTQEEMREMGVRDFSPRPIPADAVEELPKGGSVVESADSEPSNTGTETESKPMPPPAPALMKRTTRRSETSAPADSEPPIQ